MTGTFTLLQAAARFAAAGADVEAAKSEIVATACEMVAGKAKSLIGVPHGWWPPLAPETLVRKANINTPLLETGELRDSIEWNSEGSIGHVGSNSDKAVWQELGTSRGIPPRSFLGAAAMLEAPNIDKMASSLIRAAISGRLEYGTQVKELFHLLHLMGHVAHEVTETWDDFTENAENNNNEGK
jgi:phage gpG-like protein